MNIQAKKHATTTVSADALFIGINPDKPLTGVLKSLDKATNGFFKTQEKNNTLPQKAKELRTYYSVPGISAKSVVLVAHQGTQQSLAAIGKKITQYIHTHRLTTVASTLLQETNEHLSEQQVARHLTQALNAADYHCDTYQSEKKERKPISFDFLIDKDNAKITQGITQGIAIAKGMNLLKDLGNAPGNICTPKYLAKTAKELAQSFKSLSVEVLKEKEMAELGMGSLLSVAKGSVQKPRLIKLQHHGSQDDPIIFVGKGVTFDTGGISLKPGANMDEMKYDMCGAGSVLGVMQTVATLNLPINVIGIIPTVENMPSGKASKPGDIVTSLSGKTIEILNTDAEGRLILCDALTYAQQFKPKALIDIATLTGAVIIALGRHPSGMMSNNDQLAEQLTQAGENTGDRVWRLPLWEEYAEQLKSPFADLQNIGGREAGTITAGCFLGEFTKDVAWAHLDIAGTAWQTRKEGATGRPVPLLVDYLLNQVN